MTPIRPKTAPVTIAAFTSYQTAGLRLFSCRRRKPPLVQSRSIIWDDGSMAKIPFNQVPILVFVRDGVMT
jgi:hypothetical protein